MTPELRAATPAHPGRRTVHTRRELFLAAKGAAAAGGALAAAGALAGCELGRSGAAGDGAAKRAAPATIRVAAWGRADVEAYEPAAAAFMQKQPQIKVEIEIAQGSGDHYTRIMTLMAGESEQDVIYMATHPGYLQVFAAGGFKDLGEFTKQDRSFDSKAALYPQADPMTRIKGQIVGIPVDTGGYVMFYNKTALSRAGLAQPKDGWTWADFERHAKLTTAGDGVTKQWGYRTQTSRMDSWVWQNGGEYYDKNLNATKCLLNELPAAEAYQHQADMTFRRQSAPAPADLAGGAPTIQNGRVALYVEGPWAIPGMQKSELSWDVSPLPKGKKQASMLQVEILTIARRTKAPEAAWSFVKHMFSDEAQRFIVEISGRMPATQEQTRRLFVPWARDQGVTSPDAFVDLFKYGRLRPLLVRANDINAILNPAIAEILNEGKPAKATLDRVVPQIDEILKASPVI